LTHVVAYAFYLQDYLRLPPLLGVAWTLCQEIQFYLVFVLLTAWGRKADPGGGRSESLRTQILFALLTAVGVATFAGWIPDVPGSFLRYWPFFAVGVVCYRAARGRLSKRYAAALAVPAIAIVGGTEPKWAAVLAAIAALLYGTLRTNRITTISLGSMVQFLGRISYSLYLTHMLTGCRLARFVAERHDGPFNGPELLLYVLLSVVFSILSAYLFYLVVERPSHRLSKRTKLRSA
jgi:peptidoglycan/LPS O-acetylase OafA/YrhL